MDRVVFSSDQLPPGLSERERFKAWRDLYNQHVGAADLAPSDGAFAAEMAFVQTGDIALGRLSVTVARSEHGGPRATAADEERIGLLINTSAAPIHSLHRRHEEVLAPGGAMLLSRSDQGRFTPGAPRTSWVIIDMPRLAITRAAPRAEDLVGTPLPAHDEALRMAAGYATMIFQEQGFADPRLEAHVSRTILDLASLAAGAGQEAMEIASARGLRAARLDAVLRAIEHGFSEPSFSIRKVAAKLELSERYVQDLLHTTGIGFAERVLELRLQQSASLLARSETVRKVSDIALACGFNDLSYFHRCFRRRFGMTPAGARTD